METVIRAASEQVVWMHGKALGVPYPTRSSGHALEILNKLVQYGHNAVPHLRFCNFPENQRFGNTA